MSPTVFIWILNAIWHLWETAVIAARLYVNYSIVSVWLWFSAMHLTKSSLRLSVMNMGSNISLFCVWLTQWIMGCFASFFFKSAEIWKGPSTVGNLLPWYAWTQLIFVFHISKLDMKHCFAVPVPRIWLRCRELAACTKVALIVLVDRSLCFAANGSRLTNSIWKKLCCIWSCCSTRSSRATMWLLTSTRLPHPTTIRRCTGCGMCILCCHTSKYFSRKSVNYFKNNLVSVLRINHRMLPLLELRCANIFSFFMCCENPLK